MKVLNVVNGDYKVIVQQDGNIYLDTNPEGKSTADMAGGLGTVTITGNLVVQGDTTYVNVSDMQVEDNIIIINKGESGAGVTPNSGRAGITIDRGSLTDSSILLNENVAHLNSSGSSTDGTFTFVNDTGALVGIQTCSINTNGENLYLINAPGDGVVTVTGTDQYERNVFDYTNYDLDPPTGPITIVDADALPNVQALADYVDSTLAFFDDYAISEDDTAVECIDKDAANYYRTLLDPSYVLPVASKIAFRVDGSERGTFTVDGLTVDNVNVFTDTITNTNASNDLILTATNNIVRIDAIAKFEEQSSDPTGVSNYSKLYTKTPGTGIGTPGKSGVYFVNSLTADELVAKNRALLFSILF